MRKILLVCATSKMVIHFRADLIKKYQSKGYQVSVIAFDNAYSEQIKDLGVSFYSVGSNNRSLNPFSILSLKSKYKKLMKAIKPNVVMTFMLKPNVFGTLAAKSLKIKDVYSVVEGAGDAFTYKTLKWRIICSVISAMYKRAFKIPKKVVFLNYDDKDEFVKRGLIREDKACVIHGIGVNLEQFNCKPTEFNNNFLMVARLMLAKGVYVYAQAARIVKSKYPNAIFGLLGAEGQVKASDIKEYIDDGSITYYGETDDVRPYLENCSVFVLPSYYREGLPMSIMEAQASSRCIITSDWVGCKDTVKEGYNGLLVEPKNAADLAQKMIYLIENPEKVKEMGGNARRYAEENFDQKIINDRMISIVDN